MKKILIATTALVATAGFAQADVTVSGSAIAGLQYNSEGTDKVILLSKANVAFDASGETDGGLTFGFNTNHIVTNNGSVDNDDTTVYISGAFGKLSFGAVAEADEVAGLSDIGWDGLDVDDVAEAFVGDELGDFFGGGFGHNVNYTYASGPISVSLSTQLSTSHSGSNLDTYAAGAKYSFGDAYVGLGYGDHKKTGFGSASVVSVFGGGTFNNVKVAAMYSDLSLKDTVGNKADGKAFGFNAAYSMDALTLSVGAGKAEIDGAGEQTSFGVGAAYNLGGGASISGGIARIKDDAWGLDENKFALKETRADFGLKFSF